MSCCLIIDDRERAVFVHELDAEHRVERITTGDYCILDPGGAPIIIFERKTLQDFGSSLRDGRAENKNKLFAFSNETGCRVAYIIEGNPFPRESERFGGIPYKNIQSSIFHLAVEHGVTIFYTKDSKHTARFLAAFVRSMDTMTRKKNGGGAQACPAVQPDPNGQPVGGSETHELLTAKHVATDDDVLRAIWAQIPGISRATAGEYAKNFTLRAVLDGTANAREINGRKVNRRVVAGLEMARTSASIQTKMLAAVGGISRKTAGELLRERPLLELLDLGDELRRKKVGGRVLGRRADKILRLFG